MLIIGPTKKMVVMYAVGDLALIDSWEHKCSNMSIVTIYTSCFIGVYLMCYNLRLGSGCNLGKGLRKR